MLAARSLFIASGLGVVCCADAAAQRPAARTGLRTEVLGCYALYSGLKRVGVAQLYNASPSVRLDSLRASRQAGDTVPAVRAMVPLNASGEPVAPARPRPYSPSWTADSLSDTVRLSFVDGFSGAVFVLDAPRGRPDTLRGRLYELWDVGPSETTHGPARAVRQPCVRRP